MKSRFLITAFAVILGFGFCAACQKPLAKQDLTSPQQAVLASAKKFKQVYNSHDKEEMADLISEDASLVIGSGSDKRVVTKEEYLSHFPERWEKYPKFKNTFDSIDVAPSKNEATLHTHFIVKGNRYDMDWKFSRENGAWLFSGYDY